MVTSVCCLFCSDANAEVVDVDGRQVECLPSCSSDANPPRYDPIKAFEYLCGRLSDTISR